MTVHTPEELNAMSAAAYKTLENKLRRMLQRRGYTLSKSRLRDPRAIGYGGYMIFDARTSSIEAGGTPYAHTMGLDDVERWLEG